MRIGILTLPLHINYGGILQAYALQTVLERMGHEVHLITIKKKPFSLPLYIRPFCYGKRILKNMLGEKTPIFYERKHQQEQIEIRQHTSKFITHYIKQAFYDDYTEIKSSDFDAIVVGSDQVWRPFYFGSKNIEQAYLQFAEGWNIKRIAYAASFGTDNWEYSPEQTARCSSLLKKINAISVRESSAIELCQKHFKVKANWTLDPTLLLDIKDYLQIIKNTSTSKSKGNLFCYILDETEEKKKLINQIASQKKWTPFSVKAQSENEKDPITKRIQPPIEQWLRSFWDAEFVITDSFHGCVLSIIFNKPFITISNEGRGQARFDSLLKLFSLENRLINISKPSLRCLSNPIIWDDINSIRKYRKEISLHTLNKTLIINGM